MKELFNYTSEQIKYKNFSEEVRLLKETKAGTSYSKYTCINKNGVTFQEVPGLIGLTGAAVMGYVNGDRARPVIIGPATKPTVIKTSFGPSNLFFAGGQSISSDYLSVIEGIRGVSGAIITFFGNLSVGRNSLSACSNSSRGVFCAGESAGGEVNIMDYITFSQTSNATSFGNLIRYCAWRASTSSFITSRGLIAGGFGDGSDFGYTETIEYIAISSLSNSSNFGSLTEYKYGSAAVTNNIKALFAGGARLIEGGAYAFETIKIDVVTIATTGNAINFGNLSIARANLSGCSDLIKGLFVGGNNNYTGELIFNTIDYVAIASASNASDFGDLSALRSAPTAVGNTGKGYIAGGASPSLQDTIDVVTIATTGNATNFGNLSTTRASLSGCSSGQ